METELTPQAERILDCAQRLIAAGGYNGFSYADISAEVGITKPSIHHHFPKKAELVRVLLRRYRTAAAEGLAALTANVPDPMDRLRAYAAWWAACIGDGSKPICVCALLAGEMPALPEEVGAEVRLHFAHLASWLEDAMAAGKAGRPPRLHATAASEAQTFMATVHGAMLTARATGHPELFESIVGAALDRLSARR
jgi:TetR/AcrR family transcriptional repressor of nem operon